MEGASAMASIAPPLQLQPWLLQQGDTQNIKKRSNQRAAKKKLTTFLARQDSVVDSEGLLPEVKQHEEVTKTSSAIGRTIAHSQLLSRSPSHQIFDQQAAVTLQNPLTSSFLSPSPSTSKQDSKDITSQPIAGEQHTPLATMAIAPHVRARLAAEKAAAEQAALAAASASTPATADPPCDSKPPGHSPAFPPSPPISDELRSRLSSVGVKVVEPKIPKDMTAWTLVNESVDSSQPRPESLTRPEAPPTRGRGAAGSRGRPNARGGRDKARGGFTKSSRSEKPRGGAAFCKASEIPKGDPKRWETDWTGRDSAHDDAWSGQDDGWGQPPADNDGWQLQGWDGKLAPPPMDWDFRSQFRPGQNEGQIQRWLDMMEGVAMADVNRQPSLDDLSVVDGFTYTFASPQDPVPGKEYMIMGEIVPRYWIREHYHGKVPLSTFFEENIKSDMPKPIDEEDLVGAKPWWETIVRGGNFLQPCNTHDHKGIDPSEGRYEKLQRQCDFGSQNAAENMKRYELVKRGITEEKQIREAEKAAKKAALKQANGGTTPDHLTPIRRAPKDLYVRYAESDDMIAIRDIYNYYVDFTTAVSETRRLTVMEIRDQFNKIIQQSKLPYLVAYQKGKFVPGRMKGHRQYDPIQLPDEIVGFARADEYGSGTDGHRFTATLEIYVHKNCLMKGIARCLMDKALALLDPDHIEQGGYRVYGDDLCAAKPTRNIKNIVATFLSPADQPQRIDRIAKWLVGELGFTEAGNLNGIGTKLTKPINKTMFVRETGTVIDHVHPPENMRLQEAEK